MEFRSYLRLFRRWWWLVVLFATISGGIGFILTSDRPIIYESQTTVSIGNFIQTSNPTLESVNTGLYLAPTYAHLVTTQNVLQGVVDALDLPVDANALYDMVSTEILLDTTLLVIKVKGDDPTLVADIADEVARQLIANSPSNITEQQQGQLTLANRQIDRLNIQLDSLYEELVAIDAQLAVSLNPQTISQLEADRLALVDQVNYVTSVVADFMASMAYIQQRTNSLEIVEYAQAADYRSQSRFSMMIVMSAIGGAGLALGIALLIEYFDDRIRTVDEAMNTLNLPFLGAISQYKKAKSQRSNLPVVWQDQIGPVAETYHAIRTNLLALRGGKKTQTFLIVSAGPGEGKSITASNLAISLAMADFRTILIDADLRRPVLHQHFQLENQTGLSTLLQAYGDHLSPDKQRRQVLQHCLQDTGIPNLSVITSGPPPTTNPSALLSSAAIAGWHEVFQKTANVDYIIIDTPPSLAVTDSVALTSAIDAQSLLVVDAGRTRHDAARRVKQQFEAVGKPLAGVILNKLRKQNDPDYGYDYKYYTEIPKHRRVS